MTSTFDSASYLRAIGEESLVSSSHQRGQSGPDVLITEVAAALVAVGAVAAEVANQILGEYLPVGSDGKSPSEHFRPLPPPQRLIAHRVVVCDQVVVQPWGRLHVDYVCFGDRSTSVAAAAVGSAATGEPMAAGQRVMLRDDAGRVEIAHFSGQSTDGFWKGRLSTDLPLSRGTRWIEIDGARLELGDNRDDPPPVHVEGLAGTDVGERYLWLRLAVSGQGNLYFRPPASLRGVITALVAAGALDPESPVADEAQAVADALRKRAGPDYGDLPQPWASLISRFGSRYGRGRSIAAGVVTPPVDGIVIRIDGLVPSEPTSMDPSGPARGFEMHVTTSPGVWFAPHAAQIDRPRIGWWAEDDRNNYYLGSQGTWSIKDDGGHSHGTVIYQPALDPLATELRLIPTGLTERATITLALPS